jgi:hypothetical protein
VEGIGFVYLDRNDVVRHRLVKDIIDAYEKFHNGSGDARGTPGPEARSAPGDARTAPAPDSV